MKFPWELSKEKDKEEKTEIPKELDERFKALQEDSTKKFTSIEDKLKGLESITAFIDDQKKSKEDAIKAAKLVKDKDEKDKNTLSEEDLAALVITEPTKAFGIMLAQRDTTLLQLRADTVRRQVFDDNP